MEYAQAFEREAMKKRLSESDLEAPTLIDVVVRHEQAIKDVCLIARNAIDRITVLESKRNKKWVGLTDEELFKALQDASDEEAKRLPGGFRLFAKEVENLLKEKNCG